MIIINFIEDDAFSTDFEIALTNAIADHLLSSIFPQNIGLSFQNSNISSLFKAIQTALKNDFNAQDYINEAAVETDQRGDSFLKKKFHIIK